MMELDQKLKDELIANEEKRYDLGIDKKTNKKSFVKRVLDKIFNRDEDDEENEHTLTF